MNFDELRNFIISETEKLKNDLLEQLEQSKTNEILAAINGLGNRIASLERRIPIDEDDV